ncbi:MAG: GNAT family N-acetyltransferase [Pleurocapsa sp. MO_226.B13]|nr:GNAT family N-acetyltransferase [Pleurocapsa sp. MO_226.B13]
MVNKLISVAAYQEYSDRLTAENWQKMKQSLVNVAKTANDADFILAEAENEIVGAIAYYPPGKSNPRFFAPNWASLRLLAVTPNYRGQGMGKLLTIEGITRAKKDNAKGVGLHTSEAMTTAQKMYAALGFQCDRELPSMLGSRYWLYLLPLA